MMCKLRSIQTWLGLYLLIECDQNLSLFLKTREKFREGRQVRDEMLVDASDLKIS